MNLSFSNICDTGTIVALLHFDGMTRPQCSNPMTPTSDNAFFCEPCREIIVVFAVLSKFKPPQS
jgi:hypothetical protein